MNPSTLSKQAKEVFKRIEFDENEELVTEIRKHPFGLFIIYLIGSIVSIALLAVTFVIAIFTNGDRLGTGFDLSSSQPVVLVLGGLLVLISVIMTIIGAYLYESNVMLVTSEKIAQFLYKTIFDRKISQLSIGDIQDVTVSQIGLFARLFNYGTLVIETAGEQQNYTFTYTPNPYQASKDIVGAHERNLVKHGN